MRRNGAEISIVNLPTYVALFVLANLFLAPFSQTYGKQVTRGLDSENGLRFWQWDADGVLLRLTQRLPDQTRGFFEARGFAPKVADEIARACVFQSMFKNTAERNGGAIEFDLNEWRVISGTGRHRLLVRQHWDREWARRQVSKAARIAFEWSLLPTRQRYAPGDYNWGMTVYGLPPGETFDLEFSWYRNGQRFVQTLEAIECAPDIHLNPR